MSLISLPNETLLYMFALLRDQDIGRLAQTYNTVITPLALTLISEWLLRMRHGRKMIELFGDPIAYDELGICKSVHDKRKTELSPYSPPPQDLASRLGLLDYLHFDGSLDWLDSMPMELSVIAKVNLNSDSWDFPVLSDKEMKEMEQAWDQLGLVVPKTYAAITKSLDLHKRVAATGDYWGYSKSASLARIEWRNPMRITDRSTASTYGYLYWFSATQDQDLYWNWYLFLDPDEGHCVVRSDLAPEFNPFEWVENEPLNSTLSSTERDSGCSVVCIAEEIHLRLHSTSFEEYIARMYFEEMAEGFENSAQIPKELKEYLTRVHTEQGRSE